MPAPTYIPTDWVELSTWVNEANMDHIEQGIKAQSDYLATVESRLAAEEAQPDIPPVQNFKWLKGSGGALVYADITQADVTGLIGSLDSKTDKATLTTKGDMYIASGASVPARLGVGADNTLVMADSAQGVGAKWAKLVDANVAAGTNLAKLAAVTGAPDGTKYLRDDGSWNAPPGGGGGGVTRYGKTTLKNVVNTVAKTDLLNGEITIGANVMTAAGGIRFFFGGDYLNNSSGTQKITLELALGGTVLWDSGASDNTQVLPTRHAWAIVGVIQSTGGATYSTGQQGSGIFLMAQQGGAVGLGTLYDPGSGNPTRSLYGSFVSAATGVAMNAARALTFSVTHANANANVSMQLQHALVEVF